MIRNQSIKSIQNSTISSSFLAQNWQILLFLFQKIKKIYSTTTSHIIHSKLEIVISLFVSVILLFPWQNPPSFSTSLKLTILKLRLAQKKFTLTKNNLIRHGHQMSPVAHSSSNVVNYIQRQRVCTWGCTPYI